MSKTINFSGDSKIVVWCDGRYYDPFVESYRPVYSYSIITPEWQYDDNDIHGKVNEKPNVNLGCKSLLAFLIACVEASSRDSENYSLFPSHVRDWAVEVDDEIKSLYDAIC